MDCISPQRFSIFSSRDVDTLSKKEGTLLSLNQRWENQGRDKRKDCWVSCGPCSLPVTVPVCGCSLLCQMAEAEGFHAICRNRLGVSPIAIILLNKTRIESEAEQ